MRIAMGRKRRCNFCIYFLQLIFSRHFTTYKNLNIVVFVREDVANGVCEMMTGGNFNRYGIVALSLRVADNMSEGRPSRVYRLPANGPCRCNVFDISQSFVASTGRACPQQLNTYIRLRSDADAIYRSGGRWFGDAPERLFADSILEISTHTWHTWQHILGQCSENFFCF